MDNLLNQAIGDRVIVAVDQTRSGGVRVTVECKCGNRLTGLYSTLRRTKMCVSCSGKALNQKYNHTHGMTGTKAYRSWGSAKSRVLNPTDKDYSKYGGRGISICDEWKDSFEAFYRDMGEPPSKKHTLERIDVNGNYCKENCKWATPLEQTRNRTITKRHFGKTPTEWSKLLGIPYMFVFRHLGKGETIPEIQTAWKNRIRRYSIDGLTIPTWCKKHDIPYSFVYERVKAGMSSEDILSEREDFNLRKNKKPK